jgi:hypothetical protein
VTCVLVVTAKGCVFWNVTPCSVVEVYRRFRGTYYLHGQEIPFKCRCILPDYTVSNLEDGSHPTYVLFEYKTYIYERSDVT